MIHGSSSTSAPPGSCGLSSMMLDPATVKRGAWLSSHLPRGKCPARLESASTPSSYWAEVGAVGPRVLPSKRSPRSAQFPLLLSPSISRIFPCPCPAPCSANTPSCTERLLQERPKQLARWLFNPQNKGRGRKRSSSGSNWEEWRRSRGGGWRVPCQKGRWAGGASQHQAAPAQDGSARSGTRVTAVAGLAQGRGRGKGAKRGEQRACSLPYRHRAVWPA